MFRDYMGGIPIGMFGVKVAFDNERLFLRFPAGRSFAAILTYLDSIWIFTVAPLISVVALYFAVICSVHVSLRD